MQSPTQKFGRICHTRNPSLSFQSLHFPSDRQFPLYAHCNSKPCRPAPRLRCNTKCTPRPRQPDLMQTVDHRYSGKRRSSFALSDIFELDEEVEIEVSPVLPSAPNSACSTISSTRSAKSLMKTALNDLVHTVKTRLRRARSRGMFVVEPADRSARIDLCT
ncbi:hypothetical protein L226DRAFT_530679 [Lentinus tigrinus ALCF2SS1-7]|uniref:Uncharacterized protein n=1 Tax=Lentinus tigrinus ALCF2SS1-6 TaxID=1328759 RepID=A0A5C2SRX5_9APHY|nr:hypothetical protein L227DRAFT_570465 [Lentinus tigrinus ALCF2SS1-6]RPD80534.1 hypothetical protein L226DRAFT_530679 [Lentinus tigrinus ALCF2SS1-7]